jgi:hypothetical protein
MEWCIGGGGGAGGYRTSFPGGTIATASFYSGGSIPVTVGAGGALDKEHQVVQVIMVILQYLEILHQQVVEVEEDLVISRRIWKAGGSGGGGGQTVKLVLLVQEEQEILRQ